eukprot:COSAG06_NODE_1353_length_9753_cov_4.072405_1_plen_2318_part_10
MLKDCVASLLVRKLLPEAKPFLEDAFKEYGGGVSMDDHRVVEIVVQRIKQQHITFADLKEARENPKPFVASLVKKNILDFIRPVIERELERQDEFELSWSQIESVVEKLSFDKLKEGLNNPRNFVHALLQNHLVQIFRPTLEPVVEQMDLVWDNVEWMLQQIKMDDCKKLLASPDIVVEDLVNKNIIELLRRELEDASTHREPEPGENLELSWSRMLPVILTAMDFHELKEGWKDPSKFVQEFHSTLIQQSGDTNAEDYGLFQSNVPAGWQTTELSRGGELALSQTVACMVDMGWLTSCLVTPAANRLKAVSFYSNGCDNNDDGYDQYTLTAGETTIELSNEKLGSADVLLLAAWVALPTVAKSAEALVLDHSQNIGKPVVSLKPGAETGVAVRKGVFAAVDGWFGQVIQDLDEDQEVALRGLHLGSTMYSNVNKLTSVVASRSDLIEECHHLQALAYAISDSKIKTLSLKGCDMSSSSLTAFVQSVRWESSQVITINCLTNAIGDEDLAPLFRETGLRSLCGLTHRQACADFSGREFGPIDCKVIAAEYELRGFIATATRLDLSDCPLTGDRYGDEDLTGIIALFDALKTSSVIELKLAHCRLGPRSVDKLANYIREASVEVIKLDGNPIGAPVVSVKPGAETGVDVKKGVFAAVDGRIGELAMNPDSDREVKLRWLDNGSESSYTKVDKLTSVVASRADLIEDCSHIRALGEALSKGKVKQISLADAKFSSATLIEFVQSVRWETAALRSLTVDSTGVVRDQKTYTLTLGEETIDLSSKSLGAADIKYVCAWLQQPDGRNAGTTTAKVVMFDSNPIGFPSSITLNPGAKTGVDVTVGVFAALDGRFGKVTEKSSWSSEVKLCWLDDGSKSSCNENKLTSVVAARRDLIEDYSHIRALGHALSDSKVHTYGLTDCNFSAATLTTFVKSVRWETTMVAHLSLGSNRISNDAMILLLDALQDISLISLDMSNTGCGDSTLSKLVELLSEDTKFKITMVSINCLGNTFGAEALAALLTAIEGTSVRSLCGLTERQATADFSEKDLKPNDSKIIAAEYQFRGFISTVVELNMFGAIIGDAGAALVEAISSSSSLECITIGSSNRLKLPLKEHCESEILEIGLHTDSGVSTVIGWWLSKTHGAGLKSLTMEQEHEWSRRKHSTLTMGGENIDLTLPNAHYARLLAGWLTTTAATTLKSLAVNSVGVERTKDSKAKTYTLTTGAKHIDLDHMQLANEDLELLSAWLCLPAAADVTSVVVDNGVITGTKTFEIDVGGGCRDDFYVGQEQIAQLDTDISGFVAFCTSISASEQITRVSMQNCYLGPRAAALLANALKSSATVTWVSVLSNPIGDGASHLIEAFEQNDKIQTLLGLDQGVNNFHGRLESGQVKVLAAEIRHSRVAKQLAALDLSGYSPLFRERISKDGVNELAKAIFAGTTVNSLTLDSTGREDGRNPESYTLTEGEKHIRLESLGRSHYGGGHLGSSDLTLVAAWLTTDAGAAAEVLSIGDNPIGAEGGTALVEAVNSSNLKTIDIGKPLPLQESFDSDTLDLSTAYVDTAFQHDQAVDGLAPGHVAILAWWLSEFSVTVTGLNISKAIIGDAGASLVQAIASSSSLRWITIGERLELPVQDSYTSDVLDAANKGIEPGGAAVIAWWLTTSAAAGITHVDISEAAIGDAGPALVEAMKASSSIETITISKGLKLSLKKPHDSTTLDATDKGIDAGGATVIAGWISTAAAAGLSSIMLDECLLTDTKIVGKGEYYEKIEQLDADLSGFTALCSSLSSSKIVRISLRKCYLGPQVLTSLSKAISSMANVADLDISEAIIGDAGPTLVEAISASSSLKFITIGKGLRLPLKDNYGSGVLDAAGKSIEAGGTTVIAWWLTTDAAATVSVEVVKLDGNPIGFPLKVSVKPGAETGVDVKKGVFVSAGGRIGEVTTQRCEDYRVKLTWLDDGSESGWAKPANLTEVVAERSDLIEDYSHIKALGNALSDANVKQISLADTKFNSATVIEFVQSVRWDTIAAESIDLSGCGLTGATKDGSNWQNIDSDMDGFVALCAVLGKVRRVRLADCGLGPRSAAELSKIFSDADAGIESIDLSGCGLTGATKDYRGKWQNIDSNMDGFIALCGVHRLYRPVPRLGKVRTVRLADCGLGARSTAELTEAFRDADAGIAQVDLRSNELNDDALAELRGLADLTAGQIFVWAREGKIDLSSAGLTLDDITSVATFIATPAGATLNSLTVDSTGVPKLTEGSKKDTDASGPRTYTLTTGEDKIELSQKNLGSADVALLTAWLQRPEVSATVADLDISEATIGDAGPTLVEAI